MKKMRFLAVLVVVLGVPFGAQGQTDTTFVLKPMPAPVVSKFGLVKPKFSIVAPNSGSLKTACLQTV